MRKNLNSGYTLIETLVAVGLFTLVMSIAISGLLVISNANKKAEATRRIIDNLDFVIEDMVRGARQGSKYHCGDISDYQDAVSDGQDGIGRADDCSGGEYFAFEKAGGNTLSPNDQIVYRLNNAGLERTADPINGVFVRLTDPKVTVTNLKFKVTGSDGFDDKQAKVLVILQAYTGVKPEEKTVFNIQTTITQRATDL